VGAATLGIFQAYRALTDTSIAFSACGQDARSYWPTELKCEWHTPSYDNCLTVMRAGRKSMEEECNRKYAGLRKTLIEPALFGGMTFLCAGVILELVRFVAAWVISGFRS
jgi:hypothetical protein